MTSLREIIELYLQWSNFFENVMPTLSKETKISASMLEMQLSIEQRVFVAETYYNTSSYLEKKRLSAEAFHRKTHQQIENEKGQV